MYSLVRFGARPHASGPKAAFARDEEALGRAQKSWEIAGRDRSEVIFRNLAKRLDRVELSGPVGRLRSSFVGGIKQMPIRFRLVSVRN